MRRRKEVRTRRRGKGGSSSHEYPATAFTRHTAAAIANPAIHPISCVVLGQWNAPVVGASMGEKAWGASLVHRNTQQHGPP